MINRIVWLTLLLFVLSNGAASSAMPAPPLVTIQSMPERPIIEVRDGNQFLNFDMVVGNASRLTSVYDSASQLALRRSVNTDAFAPSIAVIGKQILAPGETLDVFNPFSEFESPVSLVALQYSFCLLRESTEQQREKNRHSLPDDSAAPWEDFRLGGT